MQEQEQEYEYELGFRDEITELLTIDTDKKYIPDVNKLDYFHIALCISLGRYDIIKRLTTLPPCPENQPGYVIVSINAKQIEILQFFWKKMHIEVCFLDIGCDCEFIKSIICCGIATDRNFLVYADIFGVKHWYTIMALGIAQNNEEFMMWSYNRIPQKIPIDVAVYYNRTEIVSKYILHHCAEVTYNTLRFAIWNENAHILNIMLAAKPKYFTKRYVYDYAKKHKIENIMLYTLMCGYRFTEKTDINEEICYTEKHNMIRVTECLKKLFKIN